MNQPEKPLYKRILKWAGRVLGIYVLWFLLGVLLVETGMMERFPLGFGGHITNRQGKRDFSGINLDGPHIAYRGDKAIVRFMEKVDTFLIARRDSVSTDVLGEQWWNCQPVAAPAFQFKVQDSLPNSHSKYELPDKILVVSDLEGNFDALSNLLWKNGVMNDRYAWTFRQGHVVVLGDLMDRGLEVTQCLWLLYRLEAEAAASEACYMW